jgi:thioredoxin-dependent peroxiredoxin
MSVESGSKAPDFEVLDDEGNRVSLGSFSGQKLVLYFYPKDDTPGCTTEACDARDNFPKLGSLKVAVAGVSRDSVKSHQKFKQKYDLNFPLLADEDGKMCEAYGVWKEKSMYGKTYMGIDRSTFLIDENGIVLKVWRGVKATGHMDEVIAELKSL